MHGFVLNPAAWTDAAPGTFGVSAPYYNDYRYARRPDEQLTLGRMFHLPFREGMTLQVRMEFFNPFNRQYLNNPDSGNFAATQSRDANGNTISGFGRINTGLVPFALSRTGQLLMRLTF